MTEKFYEKFIQKTKIKSSQKKEKNTDFNPRSNKKSTQKKLKVQNQDFNSSDKKENSKSNLFTQKINSLFDEQKIPQDAKAIVENFSEIIDSTHPLNSKQRQSLPKQVRELSHYLTDERGSRRVGYMNQTSALSAYVHYFLWWNLVRLTNLFANFPDSYFNLSDNAICVDIGSGPLTVPISLFLARPELRKKHLTFYCVDISQQSMTFGENLFFTIAARLQETAWKIVRVKGEFGVEIKEKAELVTCSNVFNELNETSSMPPDFLAKKLTEKLLSYTDEKNSNAKILLVEPGFPKSARLLSLLRDSLMRKNFMPFSPCTHFGECAMQGKKGEKWCNFCFGTENAPSKLKKLSLAAQLQKERLVLSFIAAKKMTAEEIQKTEDLQKDFLEFRIASDKIFLPGKRSGFYPCSKLGLLLVVTEKNLSSGDCFKIKMPTLPLLQDKKSGAGIIKF